MLGQADIAWAAGVFEGEGCITFERRHPPLPKLAVTMTDRDIVERLAAVLGVGTIKPHNRSATRRRGHKDCWTWTVAGLPAWRVYQALRPWLGERRRGRGDSVFADLSLLGPGGRARIDAFVNEDGKVCSKCGTFKGHREFASKGGGRRESRCLVCKRADYRAYWQANTEYVRERNRLAARRRRAAA